MGASDENGALETRFKTAGAVDMGLTGMRTTLVGAQKLAGQTTQIINDVPILETLGRVTGAIGAVEKFNSFNETGSYLDLAEGVALGAGALFFSEYSLTIGLTVYGIDATRALFNNNNH